MRRPPVVARTPRFPRSFRKERPLPEETRVTAGTASTLSTSVLRAGTAANLCTHVYGSGGLTISSSIADNSSAKGLTKSGSGTLTLSGTSANTYTGTTTVNAGTLVLDKSDNVNALAGDLVIGDGRGIDTVRLDSNEQILDSASVSLVGGKSGNSANVARLEMNGASALGDPAGKESFATLNVSGSSVLDFSDGTVCSPSYLYVDVLNVLSGALLTIEDWIEATDYFLVKKTSLDSSTEQAQLARVVFDGYGGSASWKDYDSDYYQIVPYSPVPEPSSFGLLTFGSLTAFAAFRRPRRSSPKRPRHAPIGPITLEG